VLLFLYYPDHRPCRLIFIRHSNSHGLDFPIHCVVYTYILTFVHSTKWYSRSSCALDPITAPPVVISVCMNYEFLPRCRPNRYGGKDGSLTSYIVMTFVPTILLIRVQRWIRLPSCISVHLPHLYHNQLAFMHGICRHGPVDSFGNEYCIHPGQFYHRFKLRALLYWRGSCVTARLFNDIVCNRPVFVSCFMSHNPDVRKW